MATLTQRTHVLEERTDRLETVFAAFMARADAAMARTDESLGRLERIIERSEQEGAREREEMRRHAERDREESARERREMNKRWGELANKWGTVVEDIVAPSVRRLAREVFDCGRQQYFATRVSRNLERRPRPASGSSTRCTSAPAPCCSTRPSPRPAATMPGASRGSWRAVNSHSTIRIIGICRSCRCSRH